MLFGTGSAKFNYSGSEVLLEYSNMTPNWNEQIINKTVCIYNHYTTYNLFGAYSDFWVEVKLFKNTSDDAETFLDIYDYLHKKVYFWPHADSNAISGSTGNAIPFFIKEMKHKYLSNDDLRYDILSIHFIATELTDITGSLK